MEELIASLKRLTLQVQNCERQLSLSLSPSPNRLPRAGTETSPSRTTTRDLVQITGPASSQKPTPTPVRNLTETPPTHLQYVFYDSSDDDAPSPPPGRYLSVPSPSTSDDDEAVAELYPVCDSCLGLYAADNTVEGSESEPFQEGSGDGSGEEDLGEVEDLEDTEGDEGVDYDYDLEPFQEGPESEYAEGVEEVDYESEPYREGSGVEEEPGPYLEGPEVDEEADGADYVDYDYDYDSEPLPEGLEVDEEVDYDSEPLRQGYGDGEEDGD
jgi:hypothetical protein